MEVATSLAVTIKVSGVRPFGARLRLMALNSSDTVSYANESSVYCVELI